MEEARQPRPPLPMLSATHLLKTHLGVEDKLGGAPCEKWGRELGQWPKAVRNRMGS